jgi:uncharacterized protein YdaU (DUF1376 family)
MSKDPAFLFYPNDYIGGTMGMTFEEKGAYIELLMLQFNRGHMTSHMIGQTIGQIWDKVKDKFIQDDNGLYYNVRLEYEQNKRKEYTASRRNNKDGINQYTKKEKKSGHMTSHMENENVIVNKEEKNNIIYRKFDHLELNLEDYEKLLLNFSKDQIDDILNRIENYKNKKKYTSLYLTALVWLKKEPKKEIKKNREWKVGFTKFTGNDEALAKAKIEYGDNLIVII